MLISFLILDFTKVKAFADTVGTVTQEEATKTQEVVTTTTDATATAPAPETVNYTQADLRLLSGIIYCESSSEKYNGKLAVGIVIMNRVRSSRYPNTVKGVIYQRSQFSPASSGRLKRVLADYDKGGFTSSLEQDCIKAAKEALNGSISININGKDKNFSKYLSFSRRIRGYTYKLGNHQFK
jgi:Cell wall hydrolyses involved in spore germination